MTGAPPVYVISASVPSGNRVKRFHSTQLDSAQRLIQDAQQLRDGGFDLRMNAVPTMTEDGAWEVKRGNRKNLRLYQDGTMIFRAAADESFLGWGVEPETFRGFPRLNPVAVVEVHVGFVMLYARVVQQLQYGPGEVLFHLELRNVTVGTRRLFLTRHVPGGHRIDMFDLHDYPAEMDPAKERVQVSPAQLSAAPWSVAYLLVEKFVSFFDLPLEDIPFVREVGGRKEIDIEGLRNPR